MSTPRYQGGQTAFISSQAQPLRTATVAAQSDDIGKSLMGLGERGMQAFQAYTQANDARQLFEAETEMQTAVADFSKFQADNPDESKWLPKWQEISDKLKQRNGDRRLSDGGRLSLVQGVGRWAANHTQRVQESALKQSASRAFQAGKNSIDAAIENGDAEGAHSAIKILEASNVVFPEQAHAMRLDVDRSIKTKVAEREFDDLAMMTASNPAMARELADEGVKAGRISDLQRFKLNEMADRESDRMRAESYTTLKRRIAVGDLPSADELKGDALLTDLDRQELIALATSQPSNDEELFQRQISNIAAMPSSASPLEKAKFEAFLEANFSGPHLDHLRGAYEEKFKGSGAESVRTSEAFQALDSAAFDEQLLGSYKKPKLDESGKPLYRKKEGLFFKADGIFGVKEKQQPDQEEQVFEEDPAEKARILREVAKVKETVANEIKSGALKSSDEVFSRVSALSRAPINRRASSELAAPPAMLLLPDKTEINLDEILNKHATNSRK